MKETPNRQRIFFAEFCCGSKNPLGQDRSRVEHLSREGVAMWRAMLDDLSGVCDVVTPVDPDILQSNWLRDWSVPANVELVEMTVDGPSWRIWADLAAGCNAALIIAPETDGLLAMAITTLRATGVTVLAPGPETLRLTSDKWLTAKFFARSGIPHPTTFATVSEKAKSILGQSDRFVVKPRDGCGSSNVRVYSELEKAIASMNSNELIQTFCNGRSASVTAISSSSGSSQAILPGVWQTIATHGHDDGSCEVLQYVGGTGPVDQESQRRIEALASRVLEELPGRFSGFLGMDMVLGDDANHDFIIELNPRLTTSYIGMRKMINENLTHRLFAPDIHPIRLAVGYDSVAWSCSDLAAH